VFPETKRGEKEEVTLKMMNVREKIVMAVDDLVLF